MKVAFISRNTLYTVKGGDTVQIVKTAKYLRKLGVEVDIFTSAEKIDYSAYDLLHGFNVIRPADLIPHFESFHGPKVLSTIYVDYSEFETQARGGITGAVFNVIGNDYTEYLKTFMRRIKNGEKSFNLSYFLKGHRKSIQRLVGLSDLLLPNSESEYQRLSSGYEVEKDYRVIPNAIDTTVFKPGHHAGKRQANLVICVARIDGIKNQLNLVRALSDTEFDLILIGKPAPNHVNYYNTCREEAGSNVTFVSEMEQEELVGYYSRARVHAMPSWFETTGLSSLEAVAMGCNVVISDRGDTSEYFDRHAFYAEPGEVKSIYDAVHKAAAAPVDEKFRQKIFSEYNWEKTAEKTYSAYRLALNAYKEKKV